MPSESMHLISAFLTFFDFIILDYSKINLNEHAFSLSQFCR